MRSTLDIFRRLPDGQPEWVEAVEGLEQAKETLIRLTSNSPAEYFIYSVADRAVVVNSNEATGPSSWISAIASSSVV